ncbi:oligosaccharide flippase family protein [Pseudarthrobacter phenanthrenivorans]
MLLARGFSTILQAFNLAVIARSVGLADFGLLGVMTSSAVLVSTMFDLGMAPLIAKSAAVSNFVTTARALRVNHLTSMMLVVISTTAFGIACLLGYLPVWPAFLALAIGLEKKIETGLSFFIARGNRIVPNLSLLVRRAVPLSATLLAVSFAVDPLAPYALAYVLACCGDLWFQSILLTKSLGIRRSSDSEFFSVVKQAWPFFIGNLTAHVRFLDISIIAAMASVQGAAMYSAASKITNPLQLIPNTLTALILPHSSRLKLHDSKRLANRVTVAFLSLLVLVTPLAFYAERIVVLVFGTTFSEAAPVLAISLISLPLVTLSSPLGSVLQSQGYEKYVALNGLVFSVLLLASLLISSHLWGVVGAALAVAAVFGLKCASLYLKIRWIN